MTRPPPPGSLRRRSLLHALGVAALRGLSFGGVGAALAGTGRAAGGDPELASFDVSRDEDGVYVSYAVDFDLGRSVDDALMKAVPLFFVAETEIFRDRWYWRDRRVAHAVRTWRIVYQPLTSTYRVTTVGGLSQSYSTRADALGSFNRSSHWKVAEAGQLEEGARHYVEFQFRLDTAELPRPMQIGISGEPDWQLLVKRTLRLN
jgi:hypothetical protein